MIDILLEPFSYQFMVVALTTTVIAAIVCALLSCWLVLMGWSLMGDAVSHAVLPGVVLAYLLGAPFSVGALAFGLAAVGLIGVVRDRSAIKEDAAIGIVFTTLFAFGLVLVSLTPSQVDLGHIIFGSLLGVSLAGFVQVVVLAAVATTLLLFKRRDLVLYAFDPVHAHAIGLNPRRLGALLLGILALTSVVAMQAVGVVLVVAMLVIPGATASLLSKRFSTILWIAPATAAGCAVVGIWASHHLDAAPGGMVVLAQGLLFAAVFVVTRLRSVPAGRSRTNRAAQSVTDTQTASVATRPSATVPVAPTTRTSTASE